MFLLLITCSLWPVVILVTPDDWSAGGQTEGGILKLNNFTFVTLMQLRLAVCVKIP